MKDTPHTPHTYDGTGLDTHPIPLLQEIQHQGKVWVDLAQQYGVTHPDPPWKITLEATCDLLAEQSCALPALERRWEEDELSESLYASVPYPERQLLALVHSLIRRGVMEESELMRCIEKVSQRLHSA